MTKYIWRRTHFTKGHLRPGNLPCCLGARRMAAIWKINSWRGQRTPSTSSYIYSSKGARMHFPSRCPRFLSDSCVFRLFRRGFRFQITPIPNPPLFARLFFEQKRERCVSPSTKIKRLGNEVMVACKFQFAIRLLFCIIAICSKLWSNSFHLGQKCRREE